jgi:hypothetical protein
VIGVLIFDQTGGKNNPRSHLANGRRQFNSVDRLHLQVGVPIQVNEPNRRTQQFGGLPRFNRPLFRSPVRGCFPSGADHEVGCAASAGFERNDSPAPEFNVVGMCAKRQ